MTQKSNRRDFVKRSAAATAGLFVFPSIVRPSALGLGGMLPPSDRVVIGSIGVGSQGMSNMRDFLRLKNGIAQFVAVCDVDSDRQKQAKEAVDAANRNKDCRMYGDFREFLEK